MAAFLTPSPPAEKTIAGPPVRWPGRGARWPGRARNNAPAGFAVARPGVPACQSGIRFTFQGTWAESPSAIGEPAAAEGRAAVTLIRCDQPGLQLLRLNAESGGAGTDIAAEAALVAISSRPVPDRL